MYKTKVFYTAAYSGKNLYQKYYDKIKSVLESLPIDLIGTEVGNYKTLLTGTELTRIKDDKKRHYLAIKKGIKWADIVILELTKESFQVGHEATQALEQKKPVLGLSLKENWGEKIDNPYFFGGKYTLYNVEKLITNFIDIYNNEPYTERINLLLSASQLEKLKKIAKQEKLNMSQIIRNFIDKTNNID